MKALSDNQLLDLWEQGRGRHHLDRSLLMLGAAYPDRSYEELKNFTLGQCNRGIAQLRRATLGEFFGVYLDCPQCGERLELSLDHQMFESALHSEAELVVEVDGSKFRPVTLHDMVLVLQEQDQSSAALSLAKACSLESIKTDRLTDDFLQELGERLDQVDPAANIELSMDCSCCHHVWSETIDIARFFWQEVEANVGRLFQDIHHLASAYGWSEAEVLSLSPDRRRIYLGMVGA